MISCINCSASSRAKWISMQPTQSSLFVGVKCLQSLLGGEKEDMSLNEYELISTLWTEPIILKQQKKWGIYQGPTQKSPSVIANKSFMKWCCAIFAGTFPLSYLSLEEENKLAFVSNIFSSLPYLNFLYSENLQNSLFLKPFFSKCISSRPLSSEEIIYIFLLPRWSRKEAEFLVRDMIF